MGFRLLRDFLETLDSEVHLKVHGSTELYMARKWLRAETQLGSWCERGLSTTFALHSHVSNALKL